jgi:excisionase family DNA binding protein
MDPTERGRALERPLKHTITIERVAQRLGVDVREAYALIRAGKLIAHQYGWQCRVKERDFADFLRLESGDAASRVAYGGADAPRHCTIL